MPSKANAPTRAPSRRFPRSSGLFGKPTTVNNVETLCNVPHIINNGAAWFRSLSRSKDGGTKLYGASGKVKRPGIWELPMGVTIREILEEHAGGMRDGVRFRGLLPGGASTDFLVEQHLDVAMDFTEVQKAGSRMGTGTMIVLDDQTCPVGMVWNLERFFAQESCGWCTPCWSGLGWVERILRAMEEGQRPARRPGQDGVSNTVLGARPHFLRACARRRRTAAERIEILPRRFRAAHHRKALPVEMTWRRCTWTISRTR